MSARLSPIAALLVLSSACTDQAFVLEVSTGPVDIIETWPNHEAALVPIDTRLVLGWRGDGEPTAVRLELRDLTDDTVVFAADEVLPTQLTTSLITLDTDLLPIRQYSLAWATPDQSLLTEPPEFPGMGFSGQGFITFTTAATSAAPADRAPAIVRLVPANQGRMRPAEVDALALIDDAALTTGQFWEVRDLEDRLFYSGVGEVPLLRASGIVQLDPAPEDGELCLSAQAFNQAGDPGAESDVSCAPIEGLRGCSTTATAPQWAWIALPLLTLWRRRRVPTSWGP